MLKWGKPPVKHLVIFRDKGLRTKSKEQDACDRRVQVLFQEKTWYDKLMLNVKTNVKLLNWISHQWHDNINNPPSNGSCGEILIADVHRARQIK